MDLAEAFLVGSQVHRNLPLSDVDSILILEADLSPLDLREVRRSLAATLRSFSARYHFKLFSSTSFHLAARYDGFRVRSFQLIHYASQPLSILPAAQPVLSVETQSIASRIQLTYGYFLFMREDSRWERQYARAVKYLQNDLLLHNVLPDSIRTETPEGALRLLAERDPELQKALALFGKATITIPQVREHLRAHFFSVPHEYVNKADSYAQHLALDLDEF